LVDVDGMEKVPGHLQLREVILLADGSEVSIGDDSGGQYLVVRVDGDNGAFWVCAPASDAAIECVRVGRASPWTVLHHSATGTVEIYRRVPDGTIAESVVLCSQLLLGSGALIAA
jgi:hypothetical protein